MGRFLEFLDKPQRSEKPRSKGITMVEGNPLPRSLLDRYADYIDIFKFLASSLWVPEEQILEDVARYKEYDIEVQVGGLPYELARMGGHEEEYWQRMKDLGVDWVEYETHVDDPSRERMAREVGELKDEGFKVVGEVGAKWHDQDETRPSVDRIDVEKTVAHFENYLEAGCEHVYWEGLVVRNLIGKNLDNGDGQKALLEVVDRVGAENVVFEVWGPTLNVRMLCRLWSWLVYQFGPDVNIANVPPGPIGSAAVGIARLENVRRGVMYEMDHPYVRWLQEGKPREDWWRMEKPNYHFDGLERKD